MKTPDLTELRNDFIDIIASEICKDQYVPIGHTAEEINSFQDRVRKMYHKNAVVHGQTKRVVARLLHAVLAQRWCYEKNHQTDEKPNEGESRAIIQGNSINFTPTGEVRRVKPLEIYMQDCGDIGRWHGKERSEAAYPIYTMNEFSYSATESLDKGKQGDGGSEPSLDQPSEVASLTSSLAKYEQALLEAREALRSCNTNERDEELWYDEEAVLGALASIDALNLGEKNYE